MEFTPIHDRVAVVLQPRTETTKGGIVIPETARQANEWGTVAASGPDCKTIQDGQQVYIRPTQGTLVKFGGQEVVILKEREILAIKTK